MSKPVDLGVDYSINSPGLCLGGSIFMFVHYDFNFVGEYSVKLPDGSFHQIFGYFYAGNHPYAGKALSIAQIFVNRLKANKTSYTDFEYGTAWIEDYALSKMQGSGRMLQIAENLGVIKAFLQLLGFKLEMVPIKTIKKVAGKGNFDKVQMADAFYDKFQYHPHEIIGCEKGASPASDVIDAFWIWETGQQST